MTEKVDIEKKLILINGLKDCAERFNKQNTSKAKSRAMSKAKSICDRNPEKV